eukprot:7270343-Pyramimonas_sp.AAC.1
MGVQRPCGRQMISIEPPIIELAILRALQLAIITCGQSEGATSERGRSQPLELSAGSARGQMHARACSM